PTDGGKLNWVMAIGRSVCSRQDACATDSPFICLTSINGLKFLSNRAFSSFQRTSALSPELIRGRMAAASIDC
ncbi:hypothetical protein C7B76_25445, partial [filamentous cyanobacterium CCP2]